MGKDEAKTSTVGEEGSPSVVGVAGMASGESAGGGIGASNARGIGGGAAQPQDPADGQGSSQNRPQPSKMLLEMASLADTLAAKESDRSAAVADAKRQQQRVQDLGIWESSELRWSACGTPV